MNIKKLINVFAIILIPISILSTFISLIMLLFKQNIAYIIIIASIVFIVNSILLFIKKNYRRFIILDVILYKLLNENYIKL